MNCYVCGEWFKRLRCCDTHWLCDDCIRDYNIDCEEIDLESVDSIHNHLKQYLKPYNSTYRYVYFILDSKSKAVKVGLSDDPVSRMNSLQIGNPNILQMLLYVRADFRLEQTLHKILRPYHIMGEWFEYTDEIKTIINTINSFYMNEKLSI